MLSLDTPTHRFQVRAAAVIRRGTHVLLHRAEGDPFWALPGGRVEPGEEASATVRRELREEMGVETDVHRLLWVAENFFTFKPLGKTPSGFRFRRCSLSYAVMWETVVNTSAACVAARSMQ